MMSKKYNCQRVLYTLAVLFLTVFKTFFAYFCPKKECALRRNKGRVIRLCYLSVGQKPASFGFSCSLTYRFD
jgi:hypothetical protein